jgi:hypothetical protein
VNDLPLDWGSLVLDDRATDDELDEEYTTIFWEDDGPEEED